MSLIKIKYSNKEEAWLWHNQMSRLAGYSYEVGRSLAEKARYKFAYKTGALSSRLADDTDNDNYLKIDSLSAVNSIILHSELDKLTDSSNTQLVNIELIDVRIEVKKENTIIDTHLVNSNTSVKELINSKNSIITITGNLHNMGLKNVNEIDKHSTDIYPLIQLMELDRLLEQLKVLGVVNVFLNALGIYRVVLKNCNYNQKEQKYFNILPFRLELESDQDNYFLVEPFK